MQMEERSVRLNLEQEGKDMVEVVLGHLAQEVRVKEPNVAREFTDIINRVREEKPIAKVDCHTVWIALDGKQQVDFPAQSYDENEAARQVMEEIEDKLGSKPQRTQS